LTLLFIAALGAVIFAAAAYSGWMKEHYGCTPCNLGSCGAGLALFFLLALTEGRRRKKQGPGHRAGPV